MYSTTILCSVFLLCLSCLNVLNILLFFCFQLWGFSGEQSVGGLISLIIQVYFRDAKTSDLQRPDITTTYDGCACLSEPPAQTSLENSPGFWGDFAVPCVSGTPRSRWDTPCVQRAAQELLLSRHLTRGRALQLQPPEHRLCDRRRGNAEDFFLSLDSLLMC